MYPFPFTLYKPVLFFMRINCTRRIQPVRVKYALNNRTHNSEWMKYNIINLIASCTVSSWILYMRRYKRSENDLFNTLSIYIEVKKGSDQFKYCVYLFMKGQRPFFFFFEKKNVLVYFKFLLSSFLLLIADLNDHVLKRFVSIRFPNAQFLNCFFFPSSSNFKTHSNLFPIESNIRSFIYKVEIIASNIHTDIKGN